MIFENIFSHKKIITKKEQKFLLEWIFKNEDEFHANYAGPHRKFLTLHKIEDVPELFYEIKERILKREKITEWKLDPFFGDIITFNTTGGFIHNHRDEAEPNKDHIRFNLFLSKPKKGGDPILMDKKLQFEEREYIKYYVNKQWHSSLPVEGDKPRIAISYGISVDNIGNKSQINTR